MKIAIIGSREFANKEQVEKIVLSAIGNINTTVITGGARGVDTWVIDICKKDATPCEVVLPVNPSNKLSYLFRNVEIITKADKVIAFWNGQSRGTRFVIDYCKARGKEISVYMEDKE